MNPKEWLRRKSSDLKRLISGPDVLDRDFPDPRLVNPARDKMQIAKIMAGVTTKEQALAQLTNSQAAGWYDYEYQKTLHDQLATWSITKARRYGATNEEIIEAIKEGNIQGATAKQGFEDYWRKGS